MENKEPDKDGIGFLIFVALQFVLVLIKMFSPTIHMTWWQAFAPTLAVVAAGVAGIVTYIIVTWLTTRD